MAQYGCVTRVESLMSATDQTFLMQLGFMSKHWSLAPGDNFAGTFCQLVQSKNNQRNVMPEMTRLFLSICSSWFSDCFKANIFETCFSKICFDNFVWDWRRFFLWRSCLWCVSFFYRKKCVRFCLTIPCVVPQTCLWFRKHVCASANLRACSSIADTRASDT